MSAYTCEHNNACVHIHVCASSALGLHTLAAETALVCAHACEWSCFTHASMLMLHLHTREGVIQRRDCISSLHGFQSKLKHNSMAEKQAYNCGSTMQSKQVSTKQQAANTLVSNVSILCVHIRAGMIAPMCAYMRRHDRACVCIYVQAWLRWHVHIQAGMIAHICEYTRGRMIAPICAYTCRLDCI